MSHISLGVFTKSLINVYCLTAGVISLLQRVLVTCVEEITSNHLQSKSNITKQALIIMTSNDPPTFSVGFHLGS